MQKKGFTHRCAFAHPQSLVLRQKIVEKRLYGSPGQAARQPLQHHEPVGLGLHQCCAALPTEALLQFAVHI